VIEPTATSSDESTAAIGEAILDYLREHPNAMDSLEGIARWWLLRQQVRVDVEAVSRALALLERNGRIESVGEDERTMFRLSAQSSDSP